MKKENQTGNNWQQIMDGVAIELCLSRMTYEILERSSDVSNLAIVGIRTGGEFLGRVIRRKIKELEGIEPPFGVLDITLYRDDIAADQLMPTLKGSSLPFKVSGSRILLVDDVLYTGRTARAALDAVVDFGRPQRVELAVLIDRGNRELPIRADYLGKHLATTTEQRVQVRFKKNSLPEGVYLDV
ncbi:MAG TPA: bifunctional pyr operon transcriptional regulator/uracil phosphoribosyltransferase PyrR [Oligoflexia bacterium]|nr:bifunctional pyr operon transcriptional regulator/uracil phosphoribosyltransferase PyrR [Oligoflexia bacterium]HMP27718.1 bifunctional pyr operon transcriptional regulator/uracil phosphoribosyltransferase PyrR [Oligoflexia bacterium]